MNPISYLKTDPVKIGLDTLSEAMPAALDSRRSGWYGDFRHRILA